STTAIPSSPMKDQSLPSPDFAKVGPQEDGEIGWNLTPSAASHTVVSTLRFGSATHASSSVRATRTRPQAVYSQNERSSSSIVQCTGAQGRPFLLVSVPMRPSLIRLSPPSPVAAHSAPSASSRSPGTWPLPNPSAAVYEART